MGQGRTLGERPPLSDACADRDDRTAPPADAELVPRPDEASERGPVETLPALELVVDRHGHAVGVSLEPGARLPPEAVTLHDAQRHAKHDDGDEGDQRGREEQPAAH